MKRQHFIDTANETDGCADCGHVHAHGACDTSGFTHKQNAGQTAEHSHAHGNCNDVGCGHAHEGCACGAVAAHIHGDGQPGKKKLLTPHNIITALGLILFCVALALHFSLDLNRWVELGIFLIPYVLIGYKVLYYCFRNLLRGRVFDENFLMTLATIGAFALGEYLEAVAVMIFYEIGERFQDYAVDRSVSRVKSMLGILPDAAVRLENGAPVTVKPAELVPGDVILLKAGARVPADAVVLEGEGSFNTSSLTGESVPRDFGEGEEILSGYINAGAAVKARVSRPAGESSAAKLLNLVESAAEKKSKSEKFITKFARVYTPIVMFAAAFVAFLLPLMTGQPYTTYFKTALVFLIVSCPCALVISIPLSYFAAIGTSAKHGALFKGSNYISVMERVNTVIFDKTGTLTQGNFAVSGIFPAEGVSEEELLALAAAGEAMSNHPIAKSVLARYGAPVELARVSDYRECAGGGVSCKVDGREVLLGKPAFLAENGVQVPDVDTPHTLVALAADGVYQGCLMLSDTPLADSKEAIALLKRAGVTPVMLTGDNRRTAEAVAKSLGIDKVYSEMLPEQKLEVVESMTASNRTGKTAYVGDGINDVLALTRADVGISTGSTADAAIESADVVIPVKSVLPVYEAKRTAKKTRKIVTENIVFSLAVKVALMALGFVVALPLWVAILGDVGCALLAVLNALRLLRSAPRKAAEAA